MNVEGAAGKKGTLVMVGVGICVGNQTTLSAIAQIKRADVVFAALAGGVAMAWLKGLNGNIVNLGQLYDKGKSRVTTYRQMVDVMVAAVESGSNVCGVFYGHAGFFAWAPHRVIQVLRAKGYQAHMEAGVSALDCLVADLGLDPGARGMQSLDPGEYGCMALETTQFLFYQLKLNPHCLLILWQVGLAGDYQFKGQDIDDNHRGLTILTEQLLAYYPPKHEIILYEAGEMAIEGPKVVRMMLQDLPKATTCSLTTLVIPSIGLAPFDHNVLAQFAIGEQQLIANLVGMTTNPLDKAFEP